MKYLTRPYFKELILDIVWYGRKMTLYLLAVSVFTAWGVELTYSQSGEPNTVDVDVPFEMMAPWFNPDQSEVVDEVLLRGTLHVTTRTWASSPDHIDRFALHANAVNIKGVSQTTGQRYRLTGSFSYDLYNPEVTFNPDGTFNVPPQPFKLQMVMVDPEPARLTKDLTGVTGATAAAVDVGPPVPCQRVYAPDGTPTTSTNCGSIVFNYAPDPNLLVYRVLSSGGDACVPGTSCVVPDGATLFNGYTGGYKSPLFGFARATIGDVPNGVEVRPSDVKWRCKTGNQETPVINTNPLSGVFIGRCNPIYSATEPISVWVELIYRSYEYRGESQPLYERLTIVNKKPFTFRMDERPMDQPPVIQNFSVKAISRATGRCISGDLCELVDGDILYNQQVGDYNPQLNLQLTATDFEGDPIQVEWFCQSGSYFAPITNLGGGQYSCNPGYIYPDPILVYAKVSDGNNVVWSPQRELYMLEFIH